MAIYKYTNDEVLLNRVKAYPKHNFYIFDGKVYHQNRPEMSGAFVNNLYDVPVGYESLYQLNVDRKQTNTGRFIGSIDADVSGNLQQVRDTNLIYPFLVKDSSGDSFKTTTEAEYAALPYGAVMSSSYMISSSITSKRYPSDYADIALYNNAAYEVLYLTYTSSNPDRQVALDVMKPNYSASKIHALENILTDYARYSPKFNISSSITTYDIKRRLVDNLGNFTFETFPAYKEGYKVYGDHKIVEIPSIFFGSSIKKGSVSLKFYITGTLIAELQDYKQNGELIQLSGTYSSASNEEVAGVVLYRHGIIILTGSWDLASEQLWYGSYTDTTDKARANWTYWGAGGNDGVTPATGITPATTSSLFVSSSYSLVFQGTNYINTMTLFSNAPKGELNWSNNPTFLQTSSYGSTGVGLLTGSYLVSQTDRTIANIVSSSFANHSASFEKVTYINQVNVYDDMGNLIGIAKTSKPIKKTEDTDFTFKLKLDM
jgi:hypothetical protein